MTANIENLKKEAGVNEVANAVFKTLAARKRARSNLSLKALTSRMRRDGFTFSPVDYAKVLQMLASTGFGKIDYSARGKVRGLRDISASLPSIGKAILGNEAQALIKDARKKKRNHFKKLSVATPPKQVTERVWKAPESKTSVYIGFMIGGKSWTLDIPKEATPEEIANIAARLQEKAL